MARINPYIHFNGNAKAAFTFYKSVFGGEFSKISHYKDIASDEYPISENDAERIMHIALPINNGNALMASDTLTSMGQVMETDNRHTVFISVESQEEAVKLFVGLSNGGTIEMPINYGPSGNYFGMFADKFGVQWMIDFDPRNT